MNRKERRQKEKQIEKLLYECIMQTMEYNSYFYLLNIKTEYKGEYHLFHNTNLNRLKEHALIVAILGDDRLQVSKDVKEAKLNNQNLKNMDISFKDKIFADQYDKVYNSSSFEELKYELVKLVDLVNKDYGVNIEINFYRNAKETLAKAYQIEQQCNCKEGCLSTILEEIIG